MVRYINTYTCCGILGLQQQQKHRHHPRLYHSLTGGEAGSKEIENGSLPNKQDTLNYLNYPCGTQCGRMALSH